MSRHYFTKNNDLKSKRKEFSFRFSNNNLTFISDNGVFSKDGVDYGSKLLLETFLNQEKKETVLDVGCGYGLLGICVAKVWDSEIDMIDINDRALALAKENGNRNKVNVNVFESNLFENVEKKYELVLTNPPIRAGKKVIYHLFAEAHKYLVEAGSLWIVIRKQHGAESAVKFLSEIYQSVHVITKSKGFWIIKAQK